MQNDIDFDIFASSESDEDADTVGSLANFIASEDEEEDYVDSDVVEDDPTAEGNAGLLPPEVIRGRNMRTTRKLIF
jgi:hypothetical protein